MKQTLMTMVAFSMTTLSIVNAYDSKTDLVPMKDYKNYYRVLDCWQCFQAQGRICHRKDYVYTPQYRIQVLRSPNIGNGVCCKPDSTQGHCQPDNAEHTCSMKSFDDSGSSTYKDVLSSSSKNFQMFAFCPTLNMQSCGLSESSNYDMTLRAGTDKQSVSSNQMRYVTGVTQDKRQYDACYYVLTAADGVETEGQDLTFQLSKKTDVNVYIYEGKSRDSATIPIIEGNSQAELGQVYRVKATSGMLVLAIPNDGKTVTEFGFDYQVQKEAKKEEPAPPTVEEDEPFHMMILLYAGIALAVIITIVIIGCVCMMRRKNSGTTPHGLDHGYELKNQTTTISESNVDVINAGEAENGAKNGNSIFYGNDTNGHDDHTQANGVVGGSQNN